jgi:hypothetical protein
MSRVPRRKFLSIAGALLVAPFAHAQQQTKVYRVGFLGARTRSTPSNPDRGYDAFVSGMRDLGYVEGRNLAIEWRFAEGKYERLPGLAAELVKLEARRTGVPRDTAGSGAETRHQHDPDCRYLRGRPGGERLGREPCSARKRHWVSTSPACGPKQLGC